MKTIQRRTAVKLQKLIEVWQQLRPTKSFAGMTLEQFKARVAPSLTAREQIVALKTQVTESKATLHSQDQTSLDLFQMVVSSIKGDPDEDGANGAMYAALGYVTINQRRSGLTRKSLTAAPSETVAAR